MRNRRSAKTGNWSLRRRRAREAFEKTWTATLTLSPSLSLNPDLLPLSFPNPTRNSTPTARTSPSAATPFRTLPRPWSTSGSRPRGRSRRRRPCGRRRLTSRRRRRHCARPLLRRWRRAKEGLRSQVLRRRWCWQQLITKHDEKSETRAARLVIQKPPPSEPELFFHSFFSLLLGLKTNSNQPAANAAVLPRPRCWPRRRRDRPPKGRARRGSEPVGGGSGGGCRSAERGARNHLCR